MSTLNQKDVKEIELEIILDIVASVTGISQKQIKSTKRDRPITMARHLYMFFASAYTKNSVVNVGAYVNKDHATVVHAKKKFHTTDFLTKYETRLYNKTKDIIKLLDPGTPTKKHKKIILKMIILEREKIIQSNNKLKELVKRL